MYRHLMDRRDSLTEAALVIVRVVYGGMIFAHGISKLDSGPEKFGDMLSGLGLPAGALLGWGGALLETVGGIMLIVGLLSRPVAVALSLFLVSAIVLVTGENGLIGTEGVGYERDLAYIGGFLVVALLGPGRLSADRVLGIERRQPALRSGHRDTSLRRGGVR